MRSKIIRDNFPKLYEKLFSECPIVVSVPGDFFWSGEHAVDYGGFGISQHLPLRIYVGLKPNGTRSLRLAEFKTFVPSDFRFVDLNVWEYSFEEIITHINSIKRKSKGYDIHVLSEIPTSCGLNSLGAFSVALALIFSMTEGKIGREDFLRLERTKASGVISDSQFDQVFHLAWRFNSLLHCGYCPPIRVFVPFVWTEFPVFCAPEVMIDRKDFLTKLDSLRYIAGSLPEICEVKSMHNWPIDIALIFSGEIRPNDLFIRAVREGHEGHWKILKKIKENLKKTDNSERIAALKHVSDDSDPWLNHINSLSTISLEVLYYLCDVFEKGTESALEGLFSAIRHCNYGLKILNLATPWTNEVINHLVRHSWRYGSVTGAAKLTGAGRGGDVLFVTTAYDFRDTIDKIVSDIQKQDKSRTVFLDYASWVDGYENRGAVLEQDLSNKVFSSWVAPDSCQLTRMGSDGKVDQSVVSPQRIEEIRNTAQIVFDKTINKIFINGKKMTSTELSSAAATIDVIEHLIGKIGRTVSNREMTHSTYANDRNEFHGKIIQPLVKAIKQFAGQNIEIKINGSVTEFSACLLPSAEIYFIKKASR